MFQFNNCDLLLLFLFCLTAMNHFAKQCCAAATHYSKISSKFAKTKEQNIYVTCFLHPTNFVKINTEHHLKETRLQHVCVITKHIYCESVQDLR